MSNIKSLLLVSGPYDLVTLLPHFDARGLHKPMLEAIMGGSDMFPAVSPSVLVRSKEYQVRGVVGRGRGQG